jgi:hypothetical protein
MAEPMDARAGGQAGGGGGRAGSGEGRAASGRGVAEATVAQILDREWEMFQEVRGLDGPAPCQQDRKTFDIMRSAQVRSWDQQTADSYLGDLLRARAGERNLMTEKYARMMLYTSPCACRGVGAVLPDLDPSTTLLVENLTAASVRWMEQAAAEYPHVVARGRPIHAYEDGTFTTSFETYTRGELATYSLKTLQLLEAHYTAMVDRGDNPAVAVLRYTAESYGYASLERAEAAAKAHAVAQGSPPA